MVPFSRTLLWRSVNTAGEQACCYVMRERGEYVVTLEEPSGCTRAITVDDIDVGVIRAMAWRDELTNRGWSVVPSDAASGE